MDERTASAKRETRRISLQGHDPLEVLKRLLAPRANKPGRKSKVPSSRGSQ